MSEDRDPGAAFRSAAQRYVAVVEGAEGRPLGELYADLVPALTALYEAGVRLPDIDTGTSDVYDAPIRIEEFSKISRSLSAALDQDDVYW